MEQKDIDKYTDAFKECLVTNGYNLVMAIRQKDVSYKQKALLHILQHSLFRSINGYQLTMDQLTEAEIEEMINNLKRNCPFLSVTDGTQFEGRLPIRIGRWIVGSTDYVSP